MKNLLSCEREFLCLDQKMSSLFKIWYDYSDVSSNLEGCGGGRRGGWWWWGGPVS